MAQNESNTSLQSLVQLTQFFRDEIVYIEHIWASFGRIMDKSNAEIRFRDDSWEQDWVLAKYAREEPAIGISGHYMPPAQFHEFPNFDIDSHVGRLAHVPGLTMKRSRASIQVSTLLERELSEPMVIRSAWNEFYDLKARIRVHLDPAMVQFNHVLPWVHLAFGHLFTGLALTPVESSFEELVPACWQRWSRIWESKDIYEEHMNVPELVQWKLDVFYGAELRKVGIAMEPSRQGQPRQWREYWQWLSAESDPQIALAAVRLAARLMVSLPIYAFFQAVFRKADTAVTTGHLLLVTVFRRLILQLGAMSWLETALQRPWKHLRSQDLVSFAFSALRPHWPRRLFGISHRSLDIKAALSATPAWENFRYSIDATFVPHWETNVATVFGLFSATPGIIRIPSEHFDDSVWCRRERELFEYLRDEDDFLDGRYLIELPQGSIGILGDAVAAGADAPKSGFFKLGRFPRLTMVFRLFPFEPWESQLLACVAAVRQIAVQTMDPILTQAVCLKLAHGGQPPPAFEPLTNHPDGWPPVIKLFEDFQQQWGDDAGRFPITLDPEQYNADELKRDIESSLNIIDLSDGVFDQLDVLAALEWNRTMVPAMVADHRYGSFFCVDYRNLNEEEWAHGEAYKVIRGINRVRTVVPIWFLQGKGQRVDEWKGMGPNPVFTQYVEGQWNWMMETLQEFDWPANFQKDCKLRFSQKLSAACAATKERGRAYYQGKLG